MGKKSKAKERANGERKENYGCTFQRGQTRTSARIGKRTKDGRRENSNAIKKESTSGKKKKM